MIGVNKHDIEQLVALAHDPTFQETTVVFATLSFQKFMALQQAGFTTKDALTIVIQQGLSWGPETETEEDENDHCA